MKTVQLGTVSVIHETWLPYAAACLISYCNKIPEIKSNYKFNNPIYKYKPVEEYTEQFKTLFEKYYIDNVFSYYFVLLKLYIL